MNKKQAKKLRIAARVAVSRGLVTAESQKNFYRFLKKNWKNGEWKETSNNQLKTSLENE